MNCELTTDRSRFDAATRTLLWARPVEHNLFLTVAESDRRGTGGWSGTPLWGWVLDEHGTVGGALMLTPPFRLRVSALSPPAVAAVVDALARRAVTLPGVGGDRATVDRFAELWAARTGVELVPTTRLRRYELATVIEPTSPPTGRARVATHADEPLLTRWFRAFHDEVGGPATDDRLEVESRRSEGRLFVWDDDGPVAVTGTSYAVAGVARIGPVYTPPERRRHGYAMALVAHVSRTTLAGGAGRCMLYTDLANPTSNAIYQRVGYQPVGDELNRDADPGPGAAAPPGGRWSGTAPAG